MRRPKSRILSICVFISVFAVSLSVQLTNTLHWPEYLLLIFVPAFLGALVIVQLFCSALRSRAYAEPFSGEAPQEQMYVDTRNPEQVPMSRIITTGAAGGFFNTTIPAALTLGCVLAVGVLVMNRNMDSSAERLLTLPVTGKHTGHSKHGTYYVAEITAPVPSPLPVSFSDKENLRISNNSIYNGIVPGTTTVGLKMHPGYLGIAWYDKGYSFSSTKFGTASGQIATVPVPDAIIKEACAWPKNFNVDRDIGVVPASDYRTRNTSNGMKIEEAIENGKIQGIARYYYPNGNRAEVTYKEGKAYGYFRLFDNSGRLIQQAAYKDGRRFGVYEIYNPDGTIAKQMLVVNDGITINKEQSMPISVCKQ